MTNREARLEAGSISKAGPVADALMERNTHLRILVQALPGSPVESAVFAAAFVSERAMGVRSGPAYLKAVEVLAAFRAVDQVYREGKLERE